MKSGGYRKKTELFYKGGEMKIKRNLRTAAGVLLVLMLAVGVQAATVLDNVAFISGTERQMTEFEILDGGRFKATLTDLEFLAPFDVLALAITTGPDVVGTLVGQGMFNFTADPGTFVANVLGIAGGDSDLSLYRLEVSAVPIPAPVLLFASGLIALITLRRRKP